MLPGSKTILTPLHRYCAETRYGIHQGEKKIHPVNRRPIPPIIAVSGASGMLGRAVRQALAARGAGVLQLVRHDPAAADQLNWNPLASPAVAKTDPLEGLIAAIHLSGAGIAAHRWTPAYKRELALSRVQTTRSLATILAGLRRPPKTLLIASAVGFYGNRGDEVLDETSGPGTGFMANLCQQWEAAARPASEAGIRVVHLRLGVVLGREGGALKKMLPLFQLGLGGPLGSGRQWMSWISLADAVAAILFALDSTALAGPVNLTAPQPVTNAEFTRSLAREIHRPAMLPAPAFALRMVLGEVADEALLASARVVPSRLTSAGFQFAHPTVDEALAAALR
jgi:uncharacterized protein (TIGR01777 family)